MRIGSSLVAAALLAPAVLGAQAADSGAFIVTLGRDTIAVERYRRSGERLVDDVLLRDRAPALERHVVVSLRADGSVSRLELDNTPVGAPGGPAGQAIHGVARFGAEEAFFDVTRNGQTTTASVVTPRGALPFLGSSFALYELVGRRARALGGRAKGPVAVPVLGFGDPAPLELTVTFPAPDSMGVARPGEGALLFRVDPAGRILGADGRLTTERVLVTRAPTLDFAAFVTAFAARPLGPLSPTDSVRATIGGAQIDIDYSRPSMRGRTIFGGVVPWNAVWRTGANYATRFSTSADLEMGGQTIPKGSYTLWTVPSPTGWTLILNKQTRAPCEGERCTLPTRPYLWGTDYSADSDFARVALRVEALAAPVEQFTIAVEPQGTGGVLTLAWERTRASLALAPKP